VEKEVFQMKLWMVTQWGNAEEGPNYADTNCIISSSDMQTAIQLAEDMFEERNKFYPTKPWTRPEADVVFLIGEDYNPDGEPLVIVQTWVDNAFNRGNNKAWYRHHEMGWITDKEMYPDYVK
jgi:hypothetical protein